MPGLFRELRQAWREEQYERYQLVGLVRRDLINFSFCRPKEPVQLEDLVPRFEAVESTPAPRRRMTVARRQEIARQIRRFFEINTGAH